MKLTGKCKQEFNQWCEDQLYDRFASEHHLNELDETCQNALIIEFFDSVGIYISIHYETFGYYNFNSMVTYRHLTTNLRSNSPTRTEPINEAILKADELFNQNK